MTTAIKLRAGTIGAAQGLWIPQMLLDQARLDADIELELHQGAILIRNVRHPRADWESQFAAMGACDDDHLLEETSLELSGCDATEWKW